MVPCKGRTSCDLRPAYICICMFPLFFSSSCLVILFECTHACSCTFACVDVASCVTGSHGHLVQLVIRLCGVSLKLHWLVRTRPHNPPLFGFVLCIDSQEFRRQTLLADLWTLYSDPRRLLQAAPALLAVGATAAALTQHRHPCLALLLRDCS